jgi:hypothetical protein
MHRQRYTKDATISNQDKPSVPGAITQGFLYTLLHDFRARIFVVAIGQAHPGVRRHAIIDIKIIMTAAMCRLSLKSFL